MRIIYCEAGNSKIATILILKNAGFSPNLLFTLVGSVKQGADLLPGGERDDPLMTATQSTVSTGHRTRVRVCVCARMHTCVRACALAYASMHA